jgi:PIN domain nuclease of toxin-antitoxin system
MNYLLDTQAFLWLATAPERLRQEVRHTIASPEHRVFLSTVVVWEIAIKSASGKLELKDDLDSFVAQQVAAMRLAHLPITVDHGLKVAKLPVLAGHRDPFDRMLIAQAKAEGMTIVTRDPLFAAYGVPIAW